MSSIIYSEKHTVKLDGKTVGEIRACYDTANGQAFSTPSKHLPGNLLGYCYFPKGGGESGRVFPTLAGCKQSLETA